MLAKLFGTPNFTPDEVVALEYSVAMFLTIQNFGLRDWKELKTGWNVRESRRRFNAAAAVSVSIISISKSIQRHMARSYFEAQRLPL